MIPQSQKPIIVYTTSKRLQC